MSERDPSADELLDLIDLYLSDLLDAESFARLEGLLGESPAARSRFALYVNHHREIEFTARASRAADTALDRLASSEGGTSPKGRRWLGGRGAWAAAALVLVTIGLAARFAPPRVELGRILGLTTAEPANVAWLLNAQDCEWSGPEKPGRDMRAGKTLGLERGLAELEFDRGARVILQGPAELELLSGSSARLIKGSLTARVPSQARGFTVLSAGGKVVDLGTEFGLSIDDKGGTVVRVFNGEVVAYPLKPASGLTLRQDQAARLNGRTVALDTAPAAWDQARYVRSIGPAAKAHARSITLDFSRPMPGTLADGRGQGVGFTHRLPGTGALLPRFDANLFLRSDTPALELTTTRSDLNTQDRMNTGEYLGFRLAELGFTGPEDFEISATMPRIPGLDVVGQFGLYVGPRSNQNIRGGLIRRPRPDLYRVFLVNNNDGMDQDIHEVGLTTAGDDLRLSLRRLAGRYSLVVENLTRKSSSTLAIAHPAFLDHATDLHAGLFGANTQSELSRTLTISEVQLTIWTTRPDSPTMPSVRKPS